MQAVSIEYHSWVLGDGSAVSVNAGRNSDAQTIEHIPSETKETDIEVAANSDPVEDQYTNSISSSACRTLFSVPNPSGTMPCCGESNTSRAAKWPDLFDLQRRALDLIATADEDCQKQPRVVTAAVSSVWVYPLKHQCCCRLSLQLAQVKTWCRWYGRD